MITNFNHLAFECSAFSKRTFSSSGSMTSPLNSGPLKRLINSQGFVGRYIPSICLAYLIDTETNVKYLLTVLGFSSFNNSC